MIKCLLSRQLEGPLHSTPLQINSQSIPRLDPIDSKSSFFYFLIKSLQFLTNGWQLVENWLTILVDKISSSLKKASQKNIFLKHKEYLATCKLANFLKVIVVGGQPCYWANFINIYRTRRLSGHNSEWMIRLWHELWSGVSKEKLTRFPVTHTRHRDDMESWKGWRIPPFSN